MKIYIAIDKDNYETIGLSKISEDKAIEECLKNDNAEIFELKNDSRKVVKFPSQDELYLLDDLDIEVTIWDTEKDPSLSIDV